MSSNCVTEEWLIILRWQFNMRYTLVCTAKISWYSSNTESKVILNNDWYGNDPTVSYKYFSRLGKPSVLNPSWNSNGIKSQISCLKWWFGWLQSGWVLNCKSTSTHLSVMLCSEGSKSHAVSSIGDHTDCVLCGVGDNVSGLPCSAVWSPNGSGTTWSSSSSSSVKNPSFVDTTTLVLGLWGVLSGTHWGGFNGRWISNPWVSCITSILEVSSELSVDPSGVVVFRTSDDGGLSVSTCTAVSIVCGGCVE